ncbi:hypothetical protein RJ55_05527 [Drechmeria coniospora]|nr:hypothetical protein RJ55_05527 [Drechmeria coniospora]
MTLHCQHSTLCTTTVHRKCSTLHCKYSTLHRKYSALLCIASILLCTHCEHSTLHRKHSTMHCCFPTPYLPMHAPSQAHPRPPTVQQPGTKVHAPGTVGAAWRADGNLAWPECEDERPAVDAARRRCRQGSASTAWPIGRRPCGGHAVMMTRIRRCVDDGSTWPTVTLHDTAKGCGLDQAEQVRSRTTPGSTRHPVRLGERAPLRAGKGWRSQMRWALRRESGRPHRLVASAPWFVASFDARGPAYGCRQCATGAAHRTSSTARQAPHVKHRNVKHRNVKHRTSSTSTAHQAPHVGHADRHSHHIESTPLRPHQTTYSTCQHTCKRSPPISRTASPLDSSTHMRGGGSSKEEGCKSSAQRRAATASRTVRGTSPGASQARTLRSAEHPRAVRTVVCARRHRCGTHSAWCPRASSSACPFLAADPPGGNGEARVGSQGTRGALARGSTRCAHGPTGLGPSPRPTVPTQASGEGRTETAMGTGMGMGVGMHAPEMMLEQTRRVIASAWKTCRDGRRAALFAPTVRGLCTGAEASKYCTVLVGVLDHGKATRFVPTPSSTPSNTPSSTPAPYCKHASTPKASHSSPPGPRQACLAAGGSGWAQPYPRQGNTTTLRAQPDAPSDFGCRATPLLRPLDVTCVDDGMPVVPVDGFERVPAWKGGEGGVGLGRRAGAPAAYQGEPVIAAQPNP